jgi:enoyl-CoA hydratase/carnithine racemase
VSEPEILHRLEGGVLILTLNHPDRLNAWTCDPGDLYFDLPDEADAEVPLKLYFSGPENGVVLKNE